MPKITLAEPWTYRTPAVTIEYPAGEHEVSDEVAEAAPKPETKEVADGDDGIAATRAPRRARSTEG